jgi:hypothetical protein
MEFNDETVQGVWEKGRAMNDMDSNEWRMDECGAWIFRDQYGNGVSEFGWKIENVAPGKPHAVENLRPYQHDNSFDIGTGQRYCKVVADRENLLPSASTDKPRNKQVR